MKIYVASAFVNIPEVEAVMAILQSIGHRVVHDWTKEHVQPEWTEDQKTEYLAKCGAADARGVRACDVLVLVNHDKGRDSMTEFGMALGLGKPVVVFYPERRSSVFFREPGVIMASTFPEFLSAVTLLARSLEAA